MKEQGRSDVSSCFEFVKKVYGELSGRRETTIWELL
jgi:hypothetical protein